MVFLMLAKAIDIHGTRRYTVQSFIEYTRDY